MIQKLFSILFLLTTIIIYPQNKNILGSRFSEERLKQILIPRSDWKPYPGINDRAAWNAVPDSIRVPVIKEADNYLEYKWPSIEATTALLFVRTGNRTEFEKIYFEKRKVLSVLVLAEIFENKGRFTDQIVNGIWNICEESSWMLPAHYGHSKAGRGLPDITEPWVDLFSAATGDLLAWTEYFLGRELDKVSPQISKRIFYETEKRILTPVLTEPHFWMKVSFNWNTWICSNWLATALILEKNKDKRVREVEKILWSLDNFLNSYPQDGGCNEGPHYWMDAGESLYETIDLLNMASDNHFNVYGNSLIRNIGTFIYKAQVTRDYFINFGDAGVKLNLDGGMVYLMGKRMNDEKMKEFGAYYYNPDRLPVDENHFTRAFLDLFELKGIDRQKKKLPLLRDVWLPDIKVMTARDNAGSDSGFCIAANAGNNGESHNHNDVGSYMIYYNNEPVLIDVGSGTYTARTFNDRRYSIWFIRSDYHNDPTVNGVDQSAGSEYKADNIEYRSGDDSVVFKFDLGKAYPSSAGLKFLRRSIKFIRNSDVEVTDEFGFLKEGNIAENLMTVYRPDITTPGVIRLKLKNGIINLKYDPQMLKATYEKRVLNGPEDGIVLQRWGDNIYRIQLTNLIKIKSGVIQLKISR